MAVPSSTAEAVRDVLLANNYTQSTAIEGWDTEDPGRLHKQFFLRGPRLVETSDVSQQAHSRWEMEVQIAWQPGQVGGDVDRFRFDLADAIASLHESWITDTTILADEFNVQTSDPEFNDDTKVWEVLVVVNWWVSRTVSA